MSDIASRSLRIFSRKNIYSLILRYIAINFPTTAYRIYRELLPRSSVYYAAKRLVEEGYAYREGAHLMPTLAAYAAYAESACDGPLAASFHRRYGVGDAKGICEFLAAVSRMRPPPKTPGEAAVRLLWPLNHRAVERLKSMEDGLRNILIHSLVNEFYTIYIEIYKGILFINKSKFIFIGINRKEGRVALKEIENPPHELL